MKRALLIFSKAPVVGVTKTRLTIERGGTLTPEQATALYQACLMDVIMASATGLKRCSSDGNMYDLLISCYPAEEISVLKELLDQLPTWSQPKEILSDICARFDDHMDYALNETLALGYESVIVIGGDLPTLQPLTIQQGFSWLDRLNSPRGALVLAPCQEGGVSLIGLTRDTPINFQGVFYNVDGVTATEALVEKAVVADIPLALLEMIPDVDYPIDLASLIPNLQAMVYAAQFQKDLVFPEHTMNLVSELGLVSRAFPENAVRGILDSNRI